MNWSPKLFTHLKYSLFVTLNLFLFILSTFALDSDGQILLSFKASVLSDPLSVLQTWNDSDANTCGWRGVKCSSPDLRVTALTLAGNRLLGSISGDIGHLPYLNHLDLSNNFLNGTLPESLFSASNLISLSLSNNEISGELSPLVGNLLSLQILNLSDNAFAGEIPSSLSSLPNLTFLSLSNNYFSGELPATAKGFPSLEVADLSSNLINGSLSPSLAGPNLRSLNLSYNRLSGEISHDFSTRVPPSARIDLSFNNFSGEIPQAGVFRGQTVDSFSGNPDLCGKPLKNPCSIPSTLSTPPNVSTSTTPLAIAAIPKTLSAGGGAAENSTAQERSGGLRPAAIVGIVVGDIAGIAVVSFVFLYLYHTRKKEKASEAESKKHSEKAKSGNEYSPSSEISSPPNRLGLWCLRRKGDNSSSSSNSNISNEGDTTEVETDEEQGGGEEKEKREETSVVNTEKQRKNNGEGKLVRVDGELELELETLLKASAYVLGVAGANIVYKAVLDDGTTFAVRRIGETSLDSFRDFETQVRVISRMRHPNILRIRGFYWGVDDKLLVFDYAANGSLAAISSAAAVAAGATTTKKQGSFTCSLPWHVRLKIARGVARGLTYLHDKKQVHGNLKPSNILLDADMEPKISDFGMDKLTLGDNSSKQTRDSARQINSKCSSLMKDNHQDITTSGASLSLSARCTSRYHAPESLKNLKPNPKWDVYSFGIVLLELLSGKVFADRELSGSMSSNNNDWNVVLGEKNRVLKMADVALRDGMEGKEEALLACFKLAFSCMSVSPQKRPQMKDALQILDKFLSSPSSGKD